MQGQNPLRQALMARMPEAPQMPMAPQMPGQPQMPHPGMGEEQGFSPEALQSLMMEHEKQQIKNKLKKIRHHEALSEAHEMLKSRQKDIESEQDSLFGE